MTVHSRLFPFFVAFLSVGLAWPVLAAAAGRPVDEHRAADPQGPVEVIDVAGRIEVVGWDKPEVAVTGTVGEAVDKVEVTTAGNRTTVRVKSHESHGIHFNWNSDGADGVRLTVHVPQRASLTAQLVSADLAVSGVAGNQDIQTVSGDVVAAAQHEVRIRTVSGDVRLTAGAETKLMELSTVSGDLSVTGGGGDVSISTVSGDGTLKLGATGRATLKTVSGDFTLALALAADGRVDMESVSGDLRVDFAGSMPPAEYDLQSFSGDLTTCTGQKAEHRGYGPGSRLNFREGAGTAHVRVDTKSGDVTLCTRR